MALLDVRRGFCFVGCGIKVRLPDATKCDGYAAAMNYDHPLAANLYCPGEATALLRVGKVERHGSSIGTVTADKSLSSNAPIDIDAIVAKHVPTPET